MSMAKMFYVGELSIRTVLPLFLFDRLACLCDLEIS